MKPEKLPSSMAHSLAILVAVAVVGLFGHASATDDAGNGWEHRMKKLHEDGVLSRGQLDDILHGGDGEKDNSESEVSSILEKLNLSELDATFSQHNIKTKNEFSNFFQSL